MRRQWIWIVAGFTLAFGFVGCGSLPDDAGNRLVVVSVTPQSGGEGFEFPAVEEVTSDVGCPEGDATTANNGFWDGCSDETFEPMAADLVDIVVSNETRNGVDEGRPLEVTGLRITYFDVLGATPAYAPQRNFGWAQQVDSDAEATLTGVPLTSKEMKSGVGGTTGLRDLFFTGTAGAQVTLSAVVDVFVEDSLNNQSFTIQTTVPLVFVNPNL